jgi:hypothetical protein
MSETRATTRLREALAGIDRIAAAGVSRYYPEPIKLDTEGSAIFVARVQADALLTIAAPLVEELSKRPQTQWGDIVAALRAKAAEITDAASSKALSQEDTK